MTIGQPDVSPELTQFVDLEMRDNFLLPILQFNK